VLDIDGGEEGQRPPKAVFHQATS
jgi:hypothetical protein